MDAPDASPEGIQARVVDRIRRCGLRISRHASRKLLFLEILDRDVVAALELGVYVGGSLRSEHNVDSSWMTATIVGVDHGGRYMMIVARLPGDESEPVGVLDVGLEQT